MRSYRIEEEVPWRDVLETLYWGLEVRVRHTRHQLERGDMRAFCMLLPSLQKEKDCVTSLRRFLRRQGAVKWEREAEELLAEAALENQQLQIPEKQVK